MSPYTFIIICHLHHPPFPPFTATTTFITVLPSPSPVPPLPLMQQNTAGIGSSQSCPKPTRNASGICLQYLGRHFRLLINKVITIQLADQYYIPRPYRTWTLQLVKPSQLIYLADPKNW
jgi:hypothetical protein